MLAARRSIVGSMRLWFLALDSRRPREVLYATGCQLMSTARPGVSRSCQRFAAVIEHQMPVLTPHLSCGFAGKHAKVTGSARA